MVLVGQREGKGRPGRFRSRGEYNIKTDLQKMGWGAWTGLIWLKEQVAGCCECGNERSCSIKYVGITDKLSLSRRTVLATVSELS